MHRPPTRRLGVLILPAFFLSACTTIQRAVDLKYPPVNAEGVQLAATDATRFQLGQLASPNFYVALSSKDLAEQLPKTISARLTPGNPDSKDTGTLKNIGLEFGQQEVVLRAAFEVVFDNEQSRASGSLEVHCSAAVENGAIVLRPAATGFHVSKMVYRRKIQLAVDAARAAINSASKRFLDNVSGAIGAQAIPIGLHERVEIDLKKELESRLKLGAADPPMTNLPITGLRASSISVNVSLGRASVLVDPDGIHAIGEIVSLNPSLFDQVGGQLKTVPPDGPKAPFSSAQLAYLANCPAPESEAGLPPPKDDKEKEFRSICHTVRPKSLVVAPTPAAGDRDSIQRKLAAAYPALITQFKSRAALIERAENLPWNTTSLAISRPAFASILNDSLGQISLSADASIPSQSVSFKQTIYTADAPNLHCRENAGACESVFSFRPYNPRGCDSNCSGWRLECVGGGWFPRICTDVPFVDLDCQARKIDCERLKEQERLAYEAEKEAAQAAWSLRKAACELAKGVQIAACEVNQGWLNDVGHKDVGEVSGVARTDAASLHISLGSVSLDPAFSALSITFQASATSAAAADITVVPHNLGNLVCYKQFDTSIKATLRVAVPEQKLGLSLKQAKSGNDSALEFLFSTSSFDVDVRTEPPLFKALMDQNAATLMTSCPVPAALAASIVTGPLAPVAIPVAIKVGENVNVPGKRITIESRDLPLTVNPLRIPIGVNAKKEPVAITVIPSWHESSLVFTKKP